MVTAKVFRHRVVGSRPAEVNFFDFFFFADSGVEWNSEQLLCQKNFPKIFPWKKLSWRKNRQADRQTGRQADRTRSQIKIVTICHIGTPLNFDPWHITSSSSIDFGELKHSVLLWWPSFTRELVENHTKFVNLICILVLDGPLDGNSRARMGILPELSLK